MEEDLTREIAAKLDADRFEAAQAMTFEQRAISGIALFDLMTASMRAGIRMQHPSATDDEVEEILLQRLRQAHIDEAAA